MGNPIDIRIKDFQSLKDVNITVSDGITIITGRTNQGKSAVIRAIDSAIFNLGDDANVRVGARYAVVSIVTDRHSMVFCRDSNGKNEKTAYQFDGGTVQKKVGRAQLPEVIKMFNIRDVRMQNNTKMKLNFWYQNDKPFLMDKSPYQMYEFLSLSSCDQYTKILKKMIVDMKVQEADINNITTEIDTLKAINAQKSKFLDANVGYEDVYHKAITLEQESRRLKSIKSVLDNISELQSKLSLAEKRHAEITELESKVNFEPLKVAYQSVLEEVKVADTMEVEVQKELALNLRLTTAQKKLFDYTYRHDSSSESIEEIRTQYENIATLSATVQSLCEAFAGIELTHKNIMVNQRNLDYYESKYGTEIDIMSIKGRLEALGDAERVLKDIMVVVSNLSALAPKIKAKDAERVQINESMIQANEEFERLKQVSGFCPLCGTTFCNHN